MRSPFANIMSVCNIMTKSIDTLDKNKLLEYIRLLENSTRNTLKLLENLLSWARSQTGNLTFRPRKIDLNALLYKTVSLYTEIANEKSISIKFESTEEIFVFGDHDMLQTVTRNLLSNAIKFTPVNGSITIECKPSGRFARVDVIDTGVGMTEENLATIFDLSVNSSTKGTNDESGTGLGLILCKEFVEINAGTIFVESEVNKGSTFSYTVPIKPKE